MARYCTNCGARLDGNPRFCGNCGRSCVATNNQPPARNSGDVRRRSTSSGIWKFFDGTAIGAFFTHLFGASSHASASNSTHTDTVEHFHDTVVYANYDDSLPSQPCRNTRERRNCEGLWYGKDGIYASILVC